MVIEADRTPEVSAPEATIAPQAATTPQAATGPQPPAQPTTTAFLTYSHKDTEFAARLEAALKARGIALLTDRGDITSFEDWWKRVEAQIAEAETTVFVLSPDSVESAVTRKQVDHAVSLDKRLIPIVCRRLHPSTVPPMLARTNPVYFDDPALFDAGVDRLAEMLATGLDWMRQHEAVAEKARGWSAAGRGRLKLLRGKALAEAERWIATRPDGVPMPAEHTLAFLAEGRKAATKRLNLVTGIAAAGFVLAVACAGLALWQRSVALDNEGKALAAADRATKAEAAALAAAELARRNEAKAVAERSIAYQMRSHLLADIAGQRIRDGDAGSGLLLALEALPAPGAPAHPHAPQAEEALREAREKLREAFVFAGHEQGVAGVALSPDGHRLATAALDGTVLIWDADKRTMTGTIKERMGVRGVAFSPDGRRLLLGLADGWVRLWDADKLTEIGGLKGHTAEVLAAQFSPDGKRIVTASADRSVRVWDTEARIQTGAFAGHGGPVSTAAFSADGRLVLTASADMSARLWDARTYREVHVFRHGAPVSSAVFTPDGKSILTASHDGTARLWDIRSRGETAAFKAPRTRMSGAVISADGAKIATASLDENAVRVFDAKSRAEILMLDGHDAPVAEAVFTPDGRFIVTASGDKSARLWSLEPPAEAAGDKPLADQIGDAHAAAPRCLSREQRRRVFLGAEPPQWCVEAEKWPYQTADWKDWLKHKRAGAEPPLPDTPEWKDWKASRSGR